MKAFGRLITAMVTPFTPDGDVWYDQARKLGQALLASGSDGLVVTGTTGEAPALEATEKVRLWAEIKDAIGDSGDMIAGAGTYSTKESISLAHEAENVGADGLLLVVPYYNKPPQDGIFEHFKAIAESTSLPCMLYNVPSRTAINMNAETTLRLAEIPNIIGVKEASGNMEQIATIVDSAPDDFLVWSGNDSDTFTVLTLGGYGIVSVASHLIGRQIKRMIEFFLAGDIDVAKEESDKQMPLAEGLFTISSPIPVKYCVNQTGFPVGPTRLPLVAADDSTKTFLDNLMQKYSIDLMENDDLT